MAQGVADLGLIFRDALFYPLPFLVSPFAKNLIPPRKSLRGLIFPLLLLSFLPSSISRAK